VSAGIGGSAQDGAGQDDTTRRRIDLASFTCLSYP